MRVTVYSVGMAVLWGSLFVITLHLFRRRFPQIAGRTPSFFLALYLLCALRMAVPVEFVTLSDAILPSLSDGIWNGLPQLRVSSGIQHQFLFLLLTLWFAVAGVLIALFLFRYNRDVCSLLRHTEPSLEGERLLLEIQQRYSRKTAVSVLVCPAVKSPMGVGLFHRRILLPCAEYRQEELRYILLHEYTHFRAGDLWIRFLLCVFQCLFWWNPTVCLLQKDVEELLEIRCDLHVTESLSVQEKTAYLEVILQAVKQASGGKASNGLRPCTPLGGGRGKRSFLAERFCFVMEESVPKKKAKGWILGVLVGALLVASYSFVPQAEAPRPDDQSPEWTIAIGAAGETAKGTGFLVTRLSQEQVLQWEQETGYEVVFQEGVLRASLPKEE